VRVVKRFTCREIQGGQIAARRQAQKNGERSMIISEHAQGTPEWMLDRTGVASASCFDKVFTTTGKPSSSSTAYLNALLAEFILGEKEQIKQNEWMERGIELEAEARQAYEFVNEVETEEVGFCFKDDAKLVGMSPDGLVEHDGLLEIKCPKASTHIGYMLGGKLPTTYFQQVHGQLFVADDRGYCDFVSYYPGLPLFQIRVWRDEKIMDMITSHMDKFIADMLSKREKLRTLIK
jgi:hypothetical protein